MIKKIFHGCFFFFKYLQKDNQNKKKIKQIIRTKCIFKILKIILTIVVIKFKNKLLPHLLLMHFVIYVYKDIVNIFAFKIIFKFLIGLL